MRAPVFGLGGRHLQEATLTLSNVSNCSPHKNMATVNIDPLSEGTELSSTLYLAEFGVQELESSFLSQIYSLRWSRLCSGVDQSWVTMLQSSMPTHSLVFSEAF